ncbi:ABC1 kinase family protein [Nesterenkonia sandarakina]|uniref:Putative unusual protein kinase regulating ubiquinone biosynthesis (AarF/ABC1/UbiB family) n=1 Tax=Nesterenkonia sandarakina TaxID=272918 RepID=A0A2T0YCU0_9MICC|nr:AarF/UbiB family protein [Nesterenkonia sandarakina]PRZ12576.1 putative unusual protein kinase regulating ubiquinone biosynthesis (AarF/ABC1/UbiB family) [Nesterenkonia sandarakina]
MSPTAKSLRSRYRRILRFAALHLVQVWWFELFLPRIGLAPLAGVGRSRRMRRLAQRFHVLAVDLGGLMIKVGQFLSSRLDVLPPEITKELEGLQDEVSPVDFAEIRSAAERELGAALEHVFSAVDSTPLAAASLGQAHRATPTVEDAEQTGIGAAVVKIQRPGIDDIVDVDLAALRRVGRWLSRIRLVSNRVDAPALVEEFAATSLQEIDYLNEAANAERFAANFAQDPRVSVPEVMWERTTRRVLTLQDVSAIKINDVARLKAAGIDPSAVAIEFANVMFDQIFVHGFFHADPHPGNIFVTPARAGAERPTSTRVPSATSTQPHSTSGDELPAEPPSPQWHLTFIDFGMMGEIPDTLRDGLRRVFIAAASRDGKGLVDAIQEVGVLLPSADTAELERAMTQLFARFGGMGFAELKEVDPREFRDFANEFGELVRSLPFQLPENFLLMLRTVSLISGVCSTLDSRFNLWDAIEPYAEQLIRDQGRPAVEDAARKAVATVSTALRLPGRLSDVVDRIEDGRITVRTPDLERRTAALERVGRRLISAVLFTGLLVTGTLLRTEGSGVGTVLMVVSLVPLLHAVFPSRRG